jgi:hypothetical protein
MCFISTPKPKAQPVVQPVRQEVVSNEDTSAIAAAAEKKRRGYSSTIATSGSGLVDPATVKKVTLGS